jgi:plastocyanin
MNNRKLQACLVATIAAAIAFSAPALAGSITGTIQFEGKAPNLRPLKMDADPGCAKKHTDPVQNEMLVLGEGNTIANIFVRISEGVPSKDYAAPSTAAVLNQEGCRYVPHVSGIMVGQDLKILNSDGLLHNIHALPKVNQEFNQAMPGSVTETVKKFSKPETAFKIKCDVHPWMAAYISVLDHPFFDVTEKDGKFTIANVPAGSYTIEAWHEKLGTQTAKVTVSGDEAQTSDFTFSAPSRK